MVKSQTGKGNENRGESFITFKERKFGEGDNHPKKFRNETRIKIGDNTGIQYRFTILAGSDVIIGRDVAIASDVFLSSGNHGIDPECNIAYGCQPYLGTPIKIEDGAWLGEKVTVLSGVTIGKKSIIGSGGVVTRDIPAYCVAVGNPARVIKKYNFHTHQWEVYNLNET